MTSDKKVILTVDDDPSTNMLMKAILEKHGFHAITTTTPEEFLKVLKNQKIDICFIDLNLGDLLGAGYQLVQAIRNVKGWDMPLFILSSRNNQEDVANALNLGATDFLFKPIDEIVLLDRLDQFADLAEPYSPLPYFEVSKSSGVSKVHFSQSIVGMNELGLIIEGSSLLSRGTHVLLTGTATETIFGKDFGELSLNVGNSWRDAETDKYRAFLEFDADHSELLVKARTFIQKNS